MNDSNSLFCLDRFGTRGSLQWGVLRIWTCLCVTSELLRSRRINTRAFLPASKRQRDSLLDNKYTVVQQSYPSSRSFKTSKQERSKSKQEAKKQRTGTQTSWEKQQDPWKSTQPPTNNQLSSQEIWRKMLVWWWTELIFHYGRTRGETLFKSGMWSTGYQFLQCLQNYRLLLCYLSNSRLAPP